jgi:hypothetical protein
MQPTVLDVTYSQIAVFHAGLQSPFNEWGDRHVAQGFSWRPGSVSFRTLDEEGPMSVTVQTGPASDPSVWAERVIRVPLGVPASGALEIATITQSIEIRLEEGDYLVVFEHGRDGDGGIRCTFRFARGTGSALLLKADGQLSPGSQLLMGARPATS